MGRKLSVIVITFNEERTITRCLQSLIPLSDNIIVVDSRSTDSTVAAARQLTPHVFVRDWEGFSEQKTFALSKAAHDWVLWVDADEEAPPELRKEIGNLDFSADAYSVPIKVRFLGRWIEHCGWYPGYKVRLFNKHRARFSDSILHESLHISGSTRRLRNPLFHYSYRDLTHYTEKMNRYTTLWAKQQAGRSRRVSLLSLVLRPGLNFFKSYVVRLGFLDRGPGLIVCILGACYTFLKYAKLRERGKEG